MRLLLHLEKELMHPIGGKKGVEIGWIRYEKDFRSLMIRTSFVVDQTWRLSWCCKMWKDCEWLDGTSLTSPGCMSLKRKDAT